MTVKAADVIKIAEGEIGYLEKASNSGLDGKTSNSGGKNFTKYARDLNNAGYYNGNKNGYEWCDVFVDWCFFVACGRDKKRAEDIQCQTGELGAGTGFSMGYYKAQGRLDMTPKPGDQIFFRYSGSGVDHTGIVTDVTSDRIETIEGNSSDSVRRKSYARSYYAIIGYGHPKYDEAEAREGKTVDITLAQVKKGDKGAEVKTVQRILKSLGYKDADGVSLSIDGSFGAKTQSALIKFQKKKKLDPDGICGINTWTKLLRG